MWGGALALMASSAHDMSAQTLHESFEVEGTYTPEIYIRERVFTLPEQLSFRMENTPLDYSVKSVTADFAPSFLNLGPSGWRTTRSIDRSKGYIDLSAGSWLQGNLSAGYRFVDDGKSRLGAMLQYDNLSLYHPFGNIPGSYSQIKQQLHDGTLGIYGSTKVADAGELSADLYYRLAYFNYPGFPGMDETQETPFQTLNNFLATARWRGKPSSIDYGASVDFEYFGYRTFTQSTTLPTGMAKGQRETRLGLSAFVSAVTGDGSTVGLDADFQMLGYTFGEIVDRPSDYGNVRLVPRYRFTRGFLNISVGAEVDLTFNAGPKDDRFGTFHVSPDFRVEYRSNGIGLYLHALGGTRLQTLSSLSTLDYYQMPDINNTTPIYSPLDATVGATFGPWSGFSLGVRGGYKITNNVLVRGLYMCNFNLALLQYAKLPTNLDMNIKGLCLGADMHYEYGHLFSLDATLDYSPQHDEKGVFNGYDRPRWVAHAGVETNPWSTLKLGLGYDYRGVRKVYYTALAGDGSQLFGYIRLTDQNLLNLHASYEVMPGLVVKGSVNNLFGCRASILPGLPGGGLNFLVGFGYRF